MAGVEPRRLIVNADDFGRSEAINQSVIEAHRRGILTTASLMVAGEAFNPNSEIRKPEMSQDFERKPLPPKDRGRLSLPISEFGFNDAVRLARENPTLGVGLHLTLCCGRAVLPPAEIPSLADASGRFSDSPVSAGMKYFFSAAARAQLAREIRAQFEKFRATGLPIDHVNGHLHFHLHPAVFPILAALFAEFGVKAMRLTRDPLRIDWPLGRGRLVYRLTHWLIFRILSGRAQPVLRRACIKHTRHVFGLLENDRVTEEYLLSLIPVLPPGDSELYAHPSLDNLDPQHLAEHAAFTSPRVRNALEKHNIELIRYQDL